MARRLGHPRRRQRLWRGRRRRRAARRPMNEAPRLLTAEPNGRPANGVESPASDLAPTQADARGRAWRAWRIAGPYLVALILLALGYLHYAPGTAYRLSAAAYRAWSFPAF